MDNKPKPIPNLIEKNHNNGYNELKNQLKDESIKDAIATITGSKLHRDNNANSSKYNNFDDPVLQEMQRQS